MKKPRCPYDGMMMQLLNPSKREFDEKWVCPKCGYTGDRFEVREERERCTETKKAT